MKLHANLVHAVVRALSEIFGEGHHADKVIERVLREDPRRGARDRRFIAETTYDIIRWKRLFETAAGSDDPRMLVGVWLIRQDIPLTGLSLFAALDEARVRRVLQSGLSRAVRESIPDWLDETGNRELGDIWPGELEALNQPAPAVLRANRLRISPRELIAILHEENVEAQELSGFPDALKLNRRMNVFRTKAFADGLFEMQDSGSQQIAPFLLPKPGMRIVDACAGAGGKTLHLAALMGNTGRIIALDTAEFKLQELRKRARRAGASTIETRLIEDNRTIKRLAGTADAVLLDVPCSGLGVLRRNPDAKWKLTAEGLETTRALQQDIIMRYSAMVKTGGLLVYATCSILPSENREQVNRFLQSNPAFGLEAERSLMPSGGTDGFYMARMRHAGK